MVLGPGLPSVVMHSPVINGSLVTSPFLSHFNKCFMTAAKNFPSSLHGKLKKPTSSHI